MPVDYRDRVGWEEIHATILRRGDNKCKECGIENGAMVYVDRCGGVFEKGWSDGFRIIDGEIEIIYQVSLGVVFLDGNISNEEDENLAVLCQRCCLVHGKKLARKRRRKAKAVAMIKKQLNLFT